MEKDMRTMAATVAAILKTPAPNRAEVKPIPEVVTHLMSVQRLAMVVIDAFGLSTWDKARDSCPTVNSLAANHFLSIRAALPPITPVNFATMVTGASPCAHAIRARTGTLTIETLFDVLRVEGKLSAALGRALSTVGIMLAPLADICIVAESNEDSELLDLGLSTLRECEPDYFLLQFLAVDATSHRYGPFSPENIQAVAETDARINELIRQLATQDYALFLLADHGQHTALPDEQRPGHIGTHDGTTEEDVNVPFIWASSRELQEVYQK